MQGSVYKRCTSCGRYVKGRSCSECSTGGISWSYRVYVGKDPSGEWIERRRGGFETKKGAERELAEVVASLNAGTFVPSKDITLGEYLQDLKAVHLNKLYAHLLADGRVDGQGGLSATTVRRVHAILRKALNDAMRWGLLQRNVTGSADPPPARVVKAARKASMRIWTWEQLRTFLEATRDHPLHPLWMLAAMTGMRRSELVGVRWPNLDLDVGFVEVRDTVVLEEDGYDLADDQKSTGSGRTIHLDDRTVERLRAHRGEIDQAREYLGSQWNAHDLAFPTEDGDWWNPPAVSLAFRRAVRALPVPRIRFHDLRHSHASLLLRAGVNPKVVSERLGHSSVAFTLDTYAHVMPGMQPEAAQLFSDLVFEDRDEPDEDEEQSS